MCNKELKIHQKKEYIYIYIERERERERENSHFWVVKIWIEWNGEYQNFIVNLSQIFVFIVNKMGRRKFKIKGRWRDRKKL